MNDEIVHFGNLLPKFGNGFSVGELVDYNVRTCHVHCADTIARRSHDSTVQCGQMQTVRAVGRAMMLRCFDFDGGVLPVDYSWLAESVSVHAGMQGTNPKQGTSTNTRRNAVSANLREPIASDSTRTNHGESQVAIRCTEDALRT